MESYSIYKMSCRECIEANRNNTPKFKCCLKEPDESFDVLRFDGSVLRVHKDLIFSEYEKYCLDRNKAYKETQKLNYAGKYEYLEWIVKVQRICPHSIVSKQSRYLLEAVNYCHSDTSLTFPFPSRGLPDQPALFFEALSIVNSKKSEAREAENGRQKNSNNTRC